MRIMNGLILTFQKPITLYVSYRTIQWLEELRMLLNNHIFIVFNRNSIIQFMLLLLCIKYDILIDGYKAIHT